MNFEPVSDPSFAELKSEIESHSRLHGYYILRLARCPNIPRTDLKMDDFLDALFQHFDDQKWPPKSSRPSDQSWCDYETDPETASVHVVNSLVGGMEVGHAVETIERQKAEDYWCRFQQLFSHPRKYFKGLGLGDHKYVFQNGVVILDNEKAGILCIVESD